MNTKMAKWAVKAAGAGTMALLLATPSFAQGRAGGNRNDSGRSIQTGGRSRDNRSQQNGYHENQRVTLSGKVTSFTHERDGYRVRLDQGAQSFWVPQSRFGSRAGDLRNGVSVSLGGVFRGGMIYVDAVSWPSQYGQGGYQYGQVRGVVDRIDARAGTIWVRDNASGRLIAADLASGRNSRSELRGLRRGDAVELTGHWSRGGVFTVASIDQYRGRR